MSNFKTRYFMRFTFFNLCTSQYQYTFTYRVDVFQSVGWKTNLGMIIIIRIKTWSRVRHKNSCYFQIIYSSPQKRSSYTTYSEVIYAVVVRSGRSSKKILYEWSVLKISHCCLGKTFQQKPRQKYHIWYSIFLWFIMTAKQEWQATIFQLI